MPSHALSSRELAGQRTSSYHYSVFYERGMHIVQLSYAERGSRIQRRGPFAEELD